MKKTFFAVILLMAVACTSVKQVELLPESAFETDIDGSQVSLYTLRGGDLVMQVTNFGGRVVSLWVPDKDGNYEDVVLGYDSIDKYVNNRGERFLGAAVGPYANRIANGTYTIDGVSYEFPKNNIGQTLHSGFVGLDMVVWDVFAADDSTLVLTYTHPDGQEGKPGNLEIFMTYTLTEDNEFKIDYMAQTDKATHVNLSHHSFFNLKGEGNGTANDHELYINASSITPVNQVLIPTGEVADITGTPFDFRVPKPIGTDIDKEDELLRRCGGYDNNWVLDRQTPDKIELAASVYEPVSGRFMEVYTDQPAIQFYGGNYFNGISVGKYGKPHKPREGIALETQKYPDAPNHENFPSTLLRPGEEYTHHCIYKFSVK